MAAAVALLEDDNDDQENAELQQFYYQNLAKLMTISLYYIDPAQLRKIAVMLHSRVRFDNDWREFAFGLGIGNNHELDVIEQAARVTRELPLFVAFDSAFQRDRSIGHIIEVVLTKQRFDVLRILRPFITTLLEMGDSTTQIKRLVSVDKQSSSHETDSTAETVRNLSSLSIGSHTCDKYEMFCNVGASRVGSRKCEFDSTEKCSANSHSSNEMENQHFSERKEISLNNVPAASAPPEEIRVFVMNTDHDASIAEELSIMLRDNGINVETLSDNFHFIMMNPNEALDAIFQKVDFIVPIVSIHFLHQVQPRDYAKYIESPEAMNNRYLYQMFMSEYNRHMCVNFRVRPMLVPGLDRNLLKNNLIFFRSSLRLWAEVPKLIDVLKKTKELLQ